MNTMHKDAVQHVSRNKHLDAHVHVAQVDALARGERTRHSRHFILQELAASSSLFRLAALYSLCHYPSLRRWTTARNSFEGGFTV